jgi:hypothetical protein
MEEEIEGTEHEQSSTGTMQNGLYDGQHGHYVFMTVFMCVHKICIAECSNPTGKGQKKHTTKMRRRLKLLWVNPARIRMVLGCRWRGWRG